MTEELLLGFDCRQSPSTDDVGRCRGFLLRQDTIPLTVDRNIWWVPDYLEKHEELFADQWRGPNAFLWEDLSALRSTMESHAGVRGTEIIAVTVCADESWKQFQGTMTSRPDGGLLYPESATPHSIARDWTRQGYDVADAFLYSALTNTGVGEMEGERVEKFASRVKLITSVQNTR